MAVRILAIESSCDDTAAAVCIDGHMLSNEIANQAVHEKFGGVVPELASRAHMQNIVPVVDTALKQAKTRMDEIDAIAFTRAPGLIGSLLVGAQFAKSLSLAWGKPLIAVNHMEAHVLANLIDDPKPAFPFLCLTVSGGHTQIVLCKSAYDMKVIGRTLDDAAGEAFDKSAKLLGLPYPGGPLIDKYARHGDASRYRFPHPQIPGLDFSFSGLKTAILYFIQKGKESDERFVEEHLADICASIQERVITILMHKLILASKETGVKEICIAGGVSANSGLRKALADAAGIQGWNYYYPALQYCTDNAGMIAITGYYKYLKGEFAELDVRVSAR